MQLDCSQHWHNIQLNVNLALNKEESGRITKEERTRGIRCEKKAARQMRGGRNANPKGKTSMLKTPLPPRQQEMSRHFFMSVGSESQIKMNIHRKQHFI